LTLRNAVSAETSQGFRRRTCVWSLAVKQTVIVAHPNPDSFNLSVARTFAEAATSAGGEVIFRDLYRENFDPCLKQTEIPGCSNYALGEDVVRERELIGDSELFVLVYPLWVNAPPAIMKGYIDRVFGYGFGFGPDGEGITPKLSGRKLLSITSSGAPRHWVVDTGALNAIRTLFDTHLAKVCGLAVVDHIHFGSITSTVTASTVEASFDSVRKSANWLNRDN
jgi:NAD(P)H dehydrogenase (quinone)